MIRMAVPDLGKEELREIEEVFKTGWLIQGSKVQEFERMVADYLGGKQAVAVSSGTTALHLALIAAGVKQGDEVVVPAATFPATANVAEHIGAKPVFVDISLDTYNIDCEQLRKVVETKRSNKTKVLMPVHLCGQSADMEPIIEIARAYNLRIIEDAAQALGAEYKGRKCGTLGHIGCFSFHPRKTITTGEGGMLVTNDDKIAEDLRVWRNHGRVDNRGRSDFVVPGFNYRMTNLQGAIGTIQMQKLRDAIAKKVRLAKIYDQLLEGLSWMKTPETISEASHSYQAYVVLLNEGIDRDAFMMRLKEREIETTIATYALHMLSYYRHKYGYEPDDFPNAKRVFEKGVALPLHPKMSEDDVEFVVEAILAIGREKL